MIATMPTEQPRPTTGHDRAFWFAELDAWGAVGRPYREIADWLTTQQGLSAWWAQKLIVEYEELRGVRKPGVRRDGTFSVGVSRSIAAPVERVYAALNNDLASSGELIVAEALEDPSAASRVSVTDGRTVAGDGPYVETKEHLAGFYLVEVDSRERAIEIAGRIPEAAIGGVEVRPILTYSGFEM